MTPRAEQLLREVHGAPPESQVQRAALYLFDALLTGSVVVTSPDGRPVTAAGLLRHAGDLPPKP